MALLLCGLTVLPVLAHAAMTPLGVWMFEDGESAVELYHCGEKLCGRTVWMASDRGADGLPLLDVHNVNVQLRTRPLCGLEFISGLKRVDSESWEEGRIYGVDQGRSYDVEIRQRDPDHLVLRGYDGLRVLGQNFELTRAPHDLPTCKAFNQPLGTK